MEKWYFFVLLTVRPDGVVEKWVEFFSQTTSVWIILIFYSTLLLVGAALGHPCNFDHIYIWIWINWRIEEVAISSTLPSFLINFSFFASALNKHEHICINLGALQKIQDIFLMNDHRDDLKSSSYFCCCFSFLVNYQMEQK